VIPSSISTEDDLVCCYTVCDSPGEAGVYAYRYRWEKIGTTFLLADQGEAGGL